MWFGFDSESRLYHGRDNGHGASALAHGEKHFVANLGAKLAVLWIFR